MALLSHMAQSQMDLRRMALSQVALSQVALSHMALCKYSSNPDGQTSPEQSRVNPTNYHSHGGTDLLDPQNSFVSRANGDGNMSGFLNNGSVILASSDTLEIDSEKEASSTALVSQVRLVTEASEGEISLIDPLDSHNSSLGVLSINSSQDELQLVGSTSVDGALSDTTSPPIKSRASTQVNSVPDLFVKH